MKHLLSFLVLAPLLLGAQPDTLPSSLVELPLAQKVLDRNYIRITGEDRIGVSFEQALGLLNQPDLLMSVQEAYADLLEEGEEPEFVITEEEPGRYRYVNREDQNTEIVELYREFSEQGEKEVVLYSKGERSFGTFQALTYIRVFPEPDNPAGSQWQVQVFAYPENGLSRFFARTFGIAQRYFNRKTEDISELVTRICLHLLTQASE